MSSSFEHNRDKRKSIESAEYEDNSCGLGSWRPKWLQPMASPTFFMLNFSIIAVIQGSYFSYLIGCSSTLEKRFSYSGSLTGFILIADNFSQILISPLIGFLGKRMNKATLIAGGMVFISFSCWLTAVPYFVYGPGTHLLEATTTNTLSSSSSHSMYNRPGGNLTGDAYDLCGANLHNTCDAESKKTSSTIWPAFIIIWMASFLNGVGYTAFYTLGFPYVDDNVGKKNAPVYFSVLSALRLLGPTSGFLLTSICLNMYEDPFADNKLEKIDPRYIGAWWIGFLIIGTLIFLSSLPLFLFPKSLREKKKPVKKRSDSLSKFQEAKTSLKRILTNPIWVLDTCAGTFRFIGYAGYYITQPKYIESQFRKTASKASFATGMYSIVAMAAGIIGGGFFIRFCRPGPRLLTSLIFFVELFANAGIISGIFFGCPGLQFFGFKEDDPVKQLDATCNSDCTCSKRVLQPVCSSDGVTNYFSPCFAGCTSSLQYNQTSLSFGSCSCDSFGGSVTQGYCPTECDTFTKYITFLSVAKFISSTSRTGNYLVRFRCVEERDKSFAMGIAMTVFGTFGSIPYPLIFGAIADSACLIWEESCGGKGNCWLYDAEKFRYYLHGAAFTFMTIGSCFDAFVIYYSKSMTNLYDDDDIEGDKSRTATITDGGGGRETNHLALQDTSCRQGKDGNDNDSRDGERHELQAVSSSPVAPVVSNEAPEAVKAQGEEVNLREEMTGDKNSNEPPPYDSENQSSSL